MTMSGNDREFDVIIYGATGYSGTIATEYMAKMAPVSVKWGVAGRSKERLHAVLARAGDNMGRMVGIFEVDAFDYDMLLGLARKTSVLVSFVGPYSKYGEPIVRACVESETDYVDVTGEPRFVHDIVSRYHDMAEKKKLYILPACGVGSLITDFAVEMVKDEFVSRDNTKAVSALGYVRYNGRYSKSFSNGTWDTLINSMSNRGGDRNSRNGSVARSAQSKPPARRGFHLFGPLRNWAVPFVEGADLHIVRRSNQMNLDSTGDQTFTYSQFVLIPLIPQFWLLKLFVLMLLVIFFSKNRYVKKWLEAAKNPQGGPTRDQRTDTSVDVWILARDSAGNSKTLKLHCPGPYDTTGISCISAALILAQRRNALKKSFGVVTPASIMAAELKRHFLECKFVTWEITSSNGGS